MSNFKCPKCDIDNIDTEYGYISGCVHYPPDFNGKYNVEVWVGSMTPKKKTRQAIYKNGRWQLGDWTKLISWSEIE